MAAARMVQVMRASTVIVSMARDSTTYDAEIDSRKPNRPTLRLMSRAPRGAGAAQVRCVQSWSCPFAVVKRLRMGIGHRGLAPGPSACLVPRVHAGQRWSADEVGGHRPQQERAGPGPGGGRGGRDDDAGAGSSLDQAGDLLVVVAADPGEVVVDDARSGAAAELDPLGGGVLVRRRRVIGAQQPKPERGPAPQPLAALPGGGVEVEPEGAARAEPGGRDGVGVPGER